MYKSFLFSLLSLLIFSNSSGSIPLLDDEIGQSMFHESTSHHNTDKLYLIYVADDPSQKIIHIFEQYCSKGQKLCTILSVLLYLCQPQVHNYLDFKAFIGNNNQQYFAIVDVQNRKKYVLPLDQTFTQQSLSSFHSNFQLGNLDPFSASEEPDSEPYEKCQKVVGKDLNKFLNRPQELKVIFLYTEHQACAVCAEMLKAYFELAERIYDKEVVVFGYYDIFKNDHPKITDEILPYFLIFSDPEQQPYGLEGDKFHELQETVIQIALKNTDIDLDAYRREHAINKNNEQLKQQYEFSYKLDKDGNKYDQNIEEL